MLDCFKRIVGCSQIEKIHFMFHLLVPGRIGRSMPASGTSIFLSQFVASPTPGLSVLLIPPCGVHCTGSGCLVSDWWNRVSQHETETWVPFRTLAVLCSRHLHLQRPCAHYRGSFPTQPLANADSVTFVEECSSCSLTALCLSQVYSKWLSYTYTGVLLIPGWVVTEHRPEFLYCAVGPC